MHDRLLEVESLVTQFTTDKGTFSVVDHVSFHIDHGETVGLVGESGSGKSITSLSLLGLIKPPGKVVSGSIRLEGEELVGKSSKAMEKYRGNKISMIFQEPMTSLNPVLTIGDQIAESIMLHQKLPRKQALKSAVHMLEKVGISEPENRLKQYPHQLSGGMRQRVMIAIALSSNPKLLIADEPTTALDVTIQAQILELMRALNKDSEMGILLVTHDLGVVAEMCQRVFVMYAGKIVEQARTEDLFSKPLHPYTEALLKSIPRISANREKLYSIPGHVPSLHQLPQGCRFHPRCPYAFDKCRQQDPELLPAENGRKVSCWKYEQGDGAELQSTGEMEA